MKKIILTCFSIVASYCMGFAQQKTADKAVIKTPGVICEFAKQRIENYVARQYGVGSVLVDLKKKTTTVTWLTDRTNIEEIKTSIANAGFDADDVTAEETAYKRLPKDCKAVPAPAPPAPEKP